MTLRTAERLQRAIAIRTMIVWRLAVMLLLGRQVPDCATDLMCSDYRQRGRE